MILYVENYDRFLLLYSYLWAVTTDGIGHFYMNMWCRTSSGEFQFIVKRLYRGYAVWKEEVLIVHWQQHLLKVEVLIVHWQKHLMKVKVLIYDCVNSLLIQCTDWNNNQPCFLATSGCTFIPTRRHLLP